MIKFENAVRAAVGVVALLVLTPLAAAEPAKKPATTQIVAAPRSVCLMAKSPRWQSLSPTSGLIKV